MFLNIKQSIQARMQMYQSKHYENTKHGKIIAGYKDKHKGERCFIIGNGPSLSADDLQVLHDHNIVTFGTNRVYNIFDKTDWRPTYFVSEDIIILKDIQETIAQIPARERFIPINLKWFEGVDIQGATYFYLDYSSDYPQTYGLSLDAAHAVRCRGTVTMSCLQLAIYMGFSEIYLLGVDHNFAKMINEDGELVIDTSIKNHFSDHYDEDIIDQGYDLKNTTMAYRCTEKLSREKGTFRVYNATRGGKLEVFERVDFDALF